MAISTDKLLLEEIKQSRKDYNATMAEISSTNQNLAVLNVKVSALSKNLSGLPAQCIEEKSALNFFRERLTNFEDTTGKMITKQSDMNIELQKLLASKDGINLKTIEGWRKLFPYLVLALLSLAGMIREGLNQISPE